MAQQFRLVKYYFIYPDLLMFDGLFIWVSHGLSENGV